MKKSQRRIDTVIGELHLVASAQALHGLFWSPRPEISAEDGDPEIRQILDLATLQVTEYLKGLRQVFDIPLAPEGTEFQKSVWRELAKIPFGKTLSYRDVAQALGKPQACRAVGSANGKNPLSLILPCHRVITSSGTLGGYAGGLQTKLKLLQLEGIEINPS